MTSETQPRKTDVQKLQRAIVDGLEDVKGQDILVLNTEHLSPLFERVIIASGTSNRQTKALASSVSDAVREAGFPKPRVEGAENGEWIIVDCGAAVAHVMQPTIRAYYHLEEIWGGKTVRLTTATAKKAEAAAASKTAPKVPARKKAAATTDAVEAPAKASPARKVAAKPKATAPKATAPEAAGVKKAPAKKAAAKAAPVATTEKKPAAKKPTATVAAKVKTLVVGKPAVKKTAAKTAGKPAGKAPAKAPVARKAPSRKSAG
jgi:ribosome-associated protein